MSGFSSALNYESIDYNLHDYSIKGYINAIRYVIYKAVMSPIFDNLIVFVVNII